MSTNGKPVVTSNYAELPVDLLLMPLGETLPLKARILILLADMHSRKSGAGVLTYKEIADVLGVAADHVGARCRELLKQDKPLIERVSLGRKEYGVRFDWRGLPETLAGLPAYRQLAWKIKGHHTKPLREFQEENVGRSLEKLTYRLTDEEYGFLESHDAFVDLGYWARQLPALLQKEGVVGSWEKEKRQSGTTATEAAVCWAVQGLHLYSRRFTVAKPAALLQTMVRNRPKYREYFQAVDLGARLALPTLSDRLSASEVKSEEAGLAREPARVASSPQAIASRPEVGRTISEFHGRQTKSEASEDALDAILNELLDIQDSSSTQAFIPDPQLR